MYRIVDMLSPDAYKSRIDQLIETTTALPLVLTHIIYQYIGRPTSNIDARRDVHTNGMIKKSFNEHIVTSVALNYWTMNRSVTIHTLRDIILDNITLHGVYNFKHVERIDVVKCDLSDCLITIDAVSIINFIKSTITRVSIDVSESVCIDKMVMNDCIMRDTKFSSALTFKHMKVSNTQFDGCDITSLFDTFVFTECSFKKCKVGKDDEMKSTWHDGTFLMCSFYKTAMRLINFTNVQFINCYICRTMFYQCVMIQCAIKYMEISQSVFHMSTFTQCVIDFTSSKDDGCQSSKDDGGICQSSKDDRGICQSSKYEYTMYCDFINCQMYGARLDQCNIMKSSITRCYALGCILVDVKSDGNHHKSKYGDIKGDMIIFQNDNRVAPYIKISCRALSIKRMLKYHINLHPQSILIASRDKAYFDADSLWKYAIMIPQMSSIFYRAAISALGPSKHKHIFPRFKDGTIVSRVSIPYFHSITRRYTCVINGTKYIYIQNPITRKFTKAEERLVNIKKILHYNKPFISINNIMNNALIMTNMHALVIATPSSSEKYIYIENLK